MMPSNMFSYYINKEMYNVSQEQDNENENDDIFLLFD